MTSDRFDAAYYERHYEDQSTRAVSPEEQRQQARFIAAYLRYLVVEVETILDIGCGIGTLLGALGREFPDAVTRGVEYSTYLCERFGWDEGSAVDYRAEPCDLVVCSDVLGYLNRRDCDRAIRNLARLTETALYVNVLTDEDLEICDKEFTDMSQHVRPVAWYRARLDRHFQAVGGGLFLKKPVRHTVWHIERG